MTEVSPLSDQRPASASPTESAWTVFLIFLRLGLTSFGGPVAHLGYFREMFVQRRQWLSDQSYAELIALCQFLPGPASSQVGMALGLSRAGLPGALAAWVGFTLPSALLLTLLALGLSSWGSQLPAGVLHGLKIVALAVVAQAVWGMARLLCIGPLRIAIAIFSTVIALLWSTVQGQLLVMGMAAVVGLVALKPLTAVSEGGLPIRLGRAGAGIALGLFFLLLVGLPVLAKLWPTPTLEWFDAFYRSGALVFGGGHVVLPLLESEVVASGWVDSDTFLAGYAAAQAVPGPLFTFAAFLGARIDGVWGALVALLGIFLPSLLLVVGVLPFWHRLRASARVQAALAGINAAVVGLLLAALYHPVMTSAIGGVSDGFMAFLALLALMRWKWPPWLVVLLGGLAGLG